MDTQTKNSRIVMITGASAGVGRATARLFAGHSARLGLIARNESRLEETKNEVEGLGGQAIIFPMDVTDSDAMERAAATLEETFGPIDVWVNNAMVTVVSEVIQMEPQEYKRVTDVCYLGFVYGTQCALKRMWERNDGKIIQVGSALAYRAIPLQSAYCGAKHAIQGFSESLRSEIIRNRKHITVTMIQMPALNTPQFAWCKTKMGCQPQPVPPIFQPEVAAKAVYIASLENRREITVGGKNLLIIALNKFLAGWGDKYLAKTGYQSQQTNESVQPDRKDNLWKTVPGSFSARGDFNERASEKTSFYWSEKHWRIVLISCSVLIILLVSYCLT